MQWIVRFAGFFLCFAAWTGCGPPGRESVLRTELEGHLQASPRSLDLLCRLHGKEGAPPPEWADDAPACLDEHADPALCRYVSVGEDRRRAILAAEGAQFSIPLTITRATRLRMACLRVGPEGSETDRDLAVVQYNSRGEEIVSWSTQELNPGIWHEIDIQLAVVDQGRLVLRVGGTRGTSESTHFALAQVRLVEPLERAASREPTNVILYLIDTLRADHTSTYGYKRVTTPRLDELAAESTVFTQAYSTSAWTRPATASLLTSLYPTHHGATDETSLPLEVVTAAEHFRRAGHSTWAFVANGNIHLKGLHFEQGFDRFQAMAGIRGDCHARTEEVNALMFRQLADFADEPFFLYVHTVDPHSPYDPPVNERGRFTDPGYSGPVRPSMTFRRQLRRLGLNEEDRAHVSALYDECILYQDAMLGELLDHLDALRLREHTLVIVTSDHGEELHDHGDWEHGSRLYEEQIRVPLVVYAPKTSAAQGRVGTRVQIIDILPTLLSWFGLPGREGCHGDDLSVLLGDSSSLYFELRPLYCEELRGGGEQSLFSLTQGSYKIIRRIGGTGSSHALYNLVEDPHEWRNLAFEEERTRDRMIQALDAYPRRFEGTFTVGDSPRKAVLDAEAVQALRALGYDE
jgi:arylsulfatase A-like enzyme